MLQSINYFLEKTMPYLIPVIVVIGVTIFSEVSAFSHWVQWIFAFVSFSSCLSFKLSDVKEAISRPFPVILCMVILQVIMPVIAYATGHLFFPDDIHTIAGFVLMFTIPTGVITLMWVSIYSGRVGLTLVIVLANTLLSPMLVPFTLNLLIGTRVSIDVPGLVEGLLWMIAIPSLLGMALNWATKGNSKALGKKLAPFSKVCVMLVILINSAVVAPFFEQINGKLILIFFLVFTLACAGYLIGLFFPLSLNLERSTVISVMFNSGMRNTGVGAALAVTYFPPATALPVVLAILFQQFLASFSGQLASKFLDKRHIIGAIGIRKNRTS